MNLEDLIKNNLEIDKKQILFNEKMSKYTSFKIGGNAECLIKINTLEELEKAIKFANENNIPVTIIGKGSNVLVLDGGIKGITLQINIKQFEILRNKEKIEVKVGAGNSNVETAQKLLKENISGFEEISGIPGTMGGTVKMNAGAYGKEIKDIIKDVTFIDFEGNIKTLKKDQLEFKYRSSMFSNKKYVIISATLELQEGNAEEIKEKMNQYSNARKEKQPLEYPSAGSTFKRGNGFITAQLIDECGLKGYEIGGAQISTKHAGFIVNKGNATAKDVLDLVKYIQNKVQEKYNEKIELEVEVIGEE